ncbi:MAG: hypothetical protein JNK77_20245 [Saprospiraceae bacterium]|nr:hypothetical protein [Saprospiraceae bacterium]
MLIVGLASCNDKKNILEINTSSDMTNHNSILFLVESANVPILEDSIELERFLTPGQMTFAFDSMTDNNFDPPVFRKLEYKDYGTIIKTKNYQTDLLLLIDNEKRGRFYSFTLNSYDKDRNKVGHLDFASWTDESHWSGKINGDTIVEIKCDETDEQRQFKISENGEFIMINTNKK